MAASVGRRPTWWDQTRVGFSPALSVSLIALGVGALLGIVASYAGSSVALSTPAVTAGAIAAISASIGVLIAAKYLFLLSTAFLAIGLPLHGLLTVRLGIPNYWKEVAVGLAILAGLRLHPRIQGGHTEVMAASALSGVAVWSAMLNRSVSTGGLSPYFAILAGYLIGQSLNRYPRALRAATMLLLFGVAANAVSFILGGSMGVSTVEYSGVPINVGGRLRPDGLAGQNLIAATLVGVGVSALIGRILVWPWSGVSRPAVRAIAISIVGILGLMFAGARAPFLALGAAVLLGGRVIRDSSSRRLAAVGLLTGIGIVATVSLALVMESQSLIVDRLGQGLASSSDAVRLQRWAASLAVWWQNPLLGGGAGATGLTAVRLSLGGGVAYLPDYGLTAIVPESNVLKVLAELGIMGFVPFVLLTLRPLGLASSRARSAYRAGKRQDAARWSALLCLLGGFLVHGLFFQSLDIYFVPLLLGAVIALIVCEPFSGRKVDRA